MRPRSAERDAHGRVDVGGARRGRALRSEVGELTGGIPVQRPLPGERLGQVAEQGDVAERVGPAERVVVGHGQSVRGRSRCSVRPVATGVWVSDASSALGRARRRSDERLDAPGRPGRLRGARLAHRGERRGQGPSPRERHRGDHRRARRRRGGAPRRARLLGHGLRRVRQQPRAAHRGRRAATQRRSSPTPASSAPSSSWSTTGASPSRAARSPSCARRWPWPPTAPGPSPAPWRRGWASAPARTIRPPSSSTSTT